MRTPFAVLAMLLLAGCLGAAPPKVETGPVDVAPDETAHPWSLALSGCRQYHAFFQARDQDFSRSVPSGFRIASDATGLFQLRIEETQCGEEGLMFIELPVVPPAELRVAGHAALLPIEVYGSNDTWVQGLRDLGLRPVEKCSCHVLISHNGPEVFVEEIHVRAANDSYNLRSVMRPSTGSFAAERLARYVVGEDKTVDSAMLANHSVAQNRGFGPVQFDYRGPGGAPPVHAGIVHVVTGLSVELVEHRFLRGQTS